MHNPAVLGFDEKRNYFNQQLHRRRKGEQRDYERLSVLVHVGSYVFEDSYSMFLHLKGDNIKYGELSFSDMDAGREWFQAVVRQMLNPDNALFERMLTTSYIITDLLIFRAPFLACRDAADRPTYQPNRMSWINPEHLSFFKFVGQFIGKAIFDGRPLDVHFTRSFYKVISTFSINIQEVIAALTRHL
jgi:E3 ubiquitin-protein ligase HUWE1